MQDQFKNAPPQAAEMQKLRDEMNKISSELHRSKQGHSNLTEEKNKLLEKLNNLEINKNDKINELQSELQHIKKELEDRIFTEEQQAVIVENQAQKIAELESQNINVNEDKDSSLVSHKIDNSYLDLDDQEIEMNILDESHNEFEKVDEINNEQKFLDENSGKLIDKPIPSEQIKTIVEEDNFLHLQYGEINIIKIDIPRAVLEIAASLKEFINKILDQKHYRLIVDLTNCDFIDSTILGVLVNTLKRVSAKNGDLRIVWYDPDKISMFYVTRMDKVFTIYSDLNAAIKNFK